MSQKPQQDLEGDSAFSARRSEVARTWFGTRRAEQRADFFLPHLQPGMRLLDCGCGPGSITVGLAAHVAPGEVVGVDVNERSLAEARQLAAQEGMTNLQFLARSVYELTFADHSFEAVFAHALLQHLTEPLKALQEMHRVLKPGGIIGLRVVDRDGWLLAPEEPLLLEFMQLQTRFAEREGGNARIGKHLRHLLHQAGFIKIEAEANYSSLATPEAVQSWVELGVAFLQEPQTAETMKDMGLVDEQKLQAIIEAWRAWGNHPGAFLARSGCRAIAYAP